MKKKRLALIMELIKNNEITTQDELLSRLREQGFEVTQATISRDIKELRLVKSLSATTGQYRYTVGKDESDDYWNKFHAIFAGSVLKVDYAGHICVLKCHSGMAPAACAALDSMHWEGLVGTLAGDDTIFVLARSEEYAVKIKSAIVKLIQP